MIFVDMDGVLADFDRHYETVFGVRPCKKKDNVDWKNVRLIKDFFFNIPPMQDLPDLWDGIAKHKPIVLTGIPESVADAAENKKAWVRRWIGKEVGVICCPSKHKYHYAHTGRILIDDRDKYKQLWLQAGGTWITHHNASKTLQKLKYFDHI